MPDYRETELPQDAETPLRFVRGERFSYRLAYARSEDFREAGQRGQDFLVLREGRDWLAFALCDGVSQSFYGDLAARILGRALIDWLTDRIAPDVAAQTVRDDLGAMLQELTRFASEAEAAFPIPDDLSPMVRDVLEQKRVEGGQANFVAGRMDLPTAAVPAGRLVLVWLGDARVRVWTVPPGEDAVSEHPFGNVFHTAERWSSRRGVIGPAPHVVVSALCGHEGARVDRFVLYSDGIPTLGDITAAPTNVALADLIDDAMHSSVNDDLCILEVWPAGAPTQIDAPVFAAPVGLCVDLLDDKLRATWSPVSGADGYQVALASTQRSVVDVPGIEWVSDRLVPGEYTVRVRARSAVGPGAWSEVIRVAVRPPRATTPAEAGPPHTAQTASPSSASPAAKPTATGARASPRGDRRTASLYALAAAVLLACVAVTVLMLLVRGCTEGRRPSGAPRSASLVSTPATHTAVGASRPSGRITAAAPTDGAALMQDRLALRTDVPIARLAPSASAAAPTASPVLVAASATQPSSATIEAMPRIPQAAGVRRAAIWTDDRGSRAMVALLSTSEQGALWEYAAEDDAWHRRMPEIAALVGVAIRSSDAAVYAAQRGGDLWRYPDGRSAERVSLPALARGDEVMGVAVSAADDRVAVWTSRKQVIFPVGNLMPIDLGGPADAAIRTVLWSPDGSRLIVCSDRFMRFYESRGGTFEESYRDPTTEASCLVAFHPNGRDIASFRNGAIRLGSIASIGSGAHTASDLALEPGTTVRALGFSGDGDALIAVTEEEVDRGRVSIVLIDVRTRSLLPIGMLDRPDPRTRIHEAAVAPDGRHAAIVWNSDTIDVYRWRR